MLIVPVAATLGATAAFLVSRYLFRKQVKSKIEDSVTLTAVDRSIAREGGRIVGLIRLTPIIPFNMMNYVFGATPISAGQYVLFSFLGMLPKTFMYVYMGSLAGTLTAVGEETLREHPFQWGIYGLGLLITIVVIIQLALVAQRMLGQIIEARNNS